MIARLPDLRIQLAAFVMALLLCNLPLSANEENPVSVNSVSALQKAVSAARPGDVIELANGTYDKGFKIKAKGKSDKPIVIRAQTTGKVLLRGQVSIAGDYLSLVGMSFTHKGSVHIKGKGCRLSRGHFYNVKTGKWVQVGAGSSKIEIDHCLFENKENNKKMKRGCQLMQISVLNKNERHHIHHNHFRDIPKGATGNGFETLQLITRGNPKNPKGDKTGNVVENNLFERCDGEAEIISVKSNGNLLRGNTFLNCRGELVLRQGHRNVVNGNWFIGGKGGIRLQGRDQVVVNNYFKYLNSGLKMMNGIKKDGKDFYVRVEKAIIAHNTFVDCEKTFVIGINHSKCPPGVVPKDCIIANNILYHGPDAKVSHIEFIDDKEPENWKWDGNIVQGKLGISPRKGIVINDAHLKREKDKLALPTAQTPSVKAPLSDIKAAEKDLFGAARNGQRTVGAIQFTAKLSAKGPLTEKQVGPDAE